MAGVVLFTVVALIWLFSGSSKSKSSPQRSISGKPPVVLVTAFEEKGVSADYIKSVKDNRKQYAAKHGRPKYPPIRELQGLLTRPYQAMKRTSCRPHFTMSKARPRPGPR